MTYWRFWLLSLLLLVGAVSAQQSHQTMPSATTSTFNSRLQDYLLKESGDRLKETGPRAFVASGGLHATSGSMTSAAFATVAYSSNGHYISQSSTAIDYSAAGCSASDTAWVVVLEATSGAVGGNFARVGSTRYAVDCTSATQPALPSGAAWLMQVTIVSSALNTVGDLRFPSSYARYQRFDITDPLYGAVAGADSTTAIQAAINGANGRGPVYIPKGSFTVTSALTGVVANQEIFGDGYASQLAFSISTGIAINVDAARCHLHDFRMSGTMGTGIRLQDDADFCVIERMDISGAVGGSSLCQSGIGVCIVDADNVTVRDNTFSANGDNAGNGGDIVQFTGGDNQVIHGNRCLSTTAGYGIQLASTFDSVISNNIINAKVTAGTAGGYGIDVYNDPAGSGGRNVVTGNVIRNTQGTGIYTLRNPYVVISNNVLETIATTQTGGSLGIGGIVVEGDSTTEAENCVITGNTVRNSGHAGIRFVGVYCNVSNNVIDTTGTQTARPGIWMTKAANGSVIANNSITLSATSGIDITAAAQEVTVTGNVIDTTTVSASANGIILNTCQSCVVSHNRIMRVGARGIYVASDGMGDTGIYTLVAHNHVVDSSQFGDASYEGIRVEAKYTQVDGNRSYTLAGTTNAQSWGVLLSATALYGDVRHNIVYAQPHIAATTWGNKTGGISIHATADPTVNRAGNRLSLEATRGTATLVAGTVTVSTRETLGASKIVLTRLDAIGTSLGVLEATSIGAGTGFTIRAVTPADAAVVATNDVSTVNWELVH